MRFIVFILPAASAHIIFNTGDVVMASPAANVETVPLERGGTRFLRARDSDLSDEERMNHLDGFALRFSRSSESLPKEEVAEVSARSNPYRSYVVDATNDVDPALLEILSIVRCIHSDDLKRLKMSNLHNDELDQLLTRIRGNETAMKHFPLYMDYTTPDTEKLFKVIFRGKGAVHREKKEAYDLLAEARELYASLTKPYRAI
ncbi:unnamed protein product [Peronospora belbahrii]|uniref:RxLR effector candidate protein n=1 Tax=Peronospora belbahrii TaxID=622444 RepID=A0AAU9KNY3_9STRA|nr:unnamed protein product [Peronospora belbahrii]